MNRIEFLHDDAVAGFTAWLARKADTLIVDLDIKPSRFVPGGIKQQLLGMDAVLPHYVWRSEGTGEGRWPETRQHLSQLAGALKDALKAGDEDAVMDVCRRILSWGGDRNAKVGAATFLEVLHANEDLAAYLTKARSAFKLDKAVLGAGDPPAARMNSMLTKVHALASDDGLPIYDSRVAAAIATLVELWRRAEGLQHTALPASLLFPATLLGRTVRDRFKDAKSPGTMSYLETKKEQTARRWSGAKIRLAWLMADVLKKSGTLFATEATPDGAGRMHAFEATLFLIGYDVKCLTRNSLWRERPRYSISMTARRAHPRRVVEDGPDIQFLQGGSQPDGPAVAEAEVTLQQGNRPDNDGAALLKNSFDVRRCVGQQGIARWLGRRRLARVGCAAQRHADQCRDANQGAASLLADR